MRRIFDKFAQRFHRQETFVTEKGVRVKRRKQRRKDEHLEQPVDDGTQPRKHAKTKTKPAKRRRQNRRKRLAVGKQSHRHGDVHRKSAVRSIDFGGKATLPRKKQQKVRFFDGRR